MMIAQKDRDWTVEEFLAWHERQEEHFELVCGYPVLKRMPVPVLFAGATAPTMITGASLRHHEVSSSLLCLLDEQLRGTSFRVFASRAAVRTAINQIRYPDLVVDWNTKLDDGCLVEQPRMTVEILSPNTRIFDLVAKITEYWSIESVTHILIVDPDKLKVQLHTRHTGKAPTVRVLASVEDTVEISDIGVTLKLADIFEGLAPVPEQ